MNKTYSVVDYPNEAYERSPIPAPPTASFGIVDMEDVKLTEDNGIVLYFKNHQFPMKGLRRGDKLIDSDTIKKYIKDDLILLASLPKFVLPFILLFSFKKISSRWLNGFAEFSISISGRHWLNPKYYSRAVREIYRVGVKLFPSEKGQWVVKTICFILSQDLPYAWRLQDLIQIFNREAVLKNPAKEIRRVLGEFTKRDGQRNWKLISWGVYALVLLRPEIRKGVRAFFEELDIEQIWFDDADLYWCLGNGDEKHGYNYLGLNREKRLELKEKIKNGEY